MNIKCFHQCPPFCAYIVLTNHMSINKCTQNIKSVTMKKPFWFMFYLNVVPFTDNFPTKQGRSIKLLKRKRI